MSKQEIEIGKAAREKLVSGINVLADAVVSTLGPNGRNVVYTKNGQVFSTKDGVTVAKEIEGVADPTENLGINMVKQAAIKTADNAGDGTTTSTLLARELVINGVQRLNDGAKAVDIKRGIDSAVKTVLKELQKNSEDITSEDQLRQIATISANNDESVGNLISRAIEKVGKEGIVHIEESKTGETYLETVEGMQFDRGYKSPYFVTNNDTMSTTLKDCYIFIADHRFNSVKEILPILNSVSSENKSLLILAEDIDGEALSTLIVNKMRGTLKVCAVKAPDFGDRRKLILEDIAILTGGKVFDKDKGMKLERWDKAWFGEARTITITKEKTTIIDGAGDEVDVLARAEELASQINISDTPFEMEKLQERLAKFSGGVAMVHVGGNTDTEITETKDRVDDALHATKAALEDGIVPGGGIALLNARKSLNKELKGENDDDFKFGQRLVYEACGKPFEQILINAGYDIHDTKMISSHNLKGKNLWEGYDIVTKSIVNMRDKGIIDPHKVTKRALINAASIAGTILLTETTIVDSPKEGNEQPMMDPSMMGGMM
jgi:chaperonin GroEL|tara:strand:- start:127 stop:1776 length:1650 start_codon:yes stop_codon:yes gene_type:complete